MNWNRPFLELNRFTVTKIESFLCPLYLFIGIGQTDKTIPFQKSQADRYRHVESTRVHFRLNLCYVSNEIHIKSYRSAKKIKCFPILRSDRRVAMLMTREKGNCIFRFFRPCLWMFRYESWPFIRSNIEIFFIRTLWLWWFLLTDSKNGKFKSSKKFFISPRFS